MTDPNSNPRIAGYCARLAEPFSIEPWNPLSKAAVEALPPLPPPLIRGWKIEGLPPPQALPVASPSPPAQGPAPAAAATSTESAFQQLTQASAQQITPLISHEHPQTIALILSQLGPDQAADILGLLSAPLQADVAYRIATMENITPTTLDHLKKSLEHTLHDILGGNKAVGGAKAMAEILNLTATSVEKNILAQFEAQDPEVAKAVKNLRFSFADIAKLTDREIQTLLREVDQKDLVIALKAASEELKEKFLSNMSEQVRIFISEELGLLSKMRLSEVEEVQLRIVQTMLALAEQGEVTLVRGRTEKMV